MSLPTPKLDDRQFQDIVDEAKKRIPLYCPEWTDHNVSDPGVTMIELFAWMTDIILYRLNQVPELHYRKFMEMFGITLKEPTPATTDMSFWLSGPQEINVLIPQHTEVSNTQTETEEPIVFSTDEQFEIQVAEFESVYTRQGRSFKKQNRGLLKKGFEKEKGLSIFSPEPQTGDSLYFGFKNNLSQHILRIELEFEGAAGAGINPEYPPYVMEATADHPNSGQKRKWVPCTVDRNGDTTKGLNVSGRIEVRIPKVERSTVQSSKEKKGGDEQFWLRFKVKPISEDEQKLGMIAYTKSPKLQRIHTVVSIGATTTATHARFVEDEFLGESTGEPNQRFALQLPPLLGRKKDENDSYDNQDGEYVCIRSIKYITVKNEGVNAKEEIKEEIEEEVWQEVSDFSRSEYFDKHYTVDRTNGEVRFGPTVRTPDGGIKQYGATPSRGAKIYFARYRHGGGEIANVEKGKLNTLKSSIPYIDRVANHEPAEGGLDSEPIEDAIIRMPGLLRSQQRAVTQDDFEFLTNEILAEKIARVKCVQVDPDTAGAAGQIHVVVIPKVSDPQGYIEPSELEPDKEDMIKLKSYLDERRLLTARLEMPNKPAYKWVSVTVNVGPTPGTDHKTIEDEILRQLHRYLNPLVGGDDGKGWPFGKTLRDVDVYHCLRDLPSSPAIQNIELFAATPSGDLVGDPESAIELVGHGVIVSAPHHVEFLSR